MAADGFAAHASTCGLSSCQPHKTHDSHGKNVVEDAPVLQRMPVQPTPSPSRSRYARHFRLRTVYESPHEDEQSGPTTAVGNEDASAANYPCKFRAFVQDATNYSQGPSKLSKGREEHDVEMSTCDTLPDFDETVAAGDSEQEVVSVRACTTTPLERTSPMMVLPSCEEIMAAFVLDSDED